MEHEQIIEVEVGTQASQVCSNTLKPNTVIPNVVVNDEGDDSDDYDLDSSSSEDDSDVDFEDSDYNMTDDDEEFELNVDKDEEFVGLHNKDEMDQSYAETLENLADIDGDSDRDSSEFSSGETSSDEEAGPSKKKAKFPVFNEKTDMQNPRFAVGMEFKSHALFRDAVKEHAIKCGKVIKFLKSDRKKVTAVCNGGKKRGCQWRIHASHVESDNLFRVKTFEGKHTCSRTYHVPWVSSKWICNKYLDRIRNNPTWPVKSLALTIEKEWTCKVSWTRVYRGKKKAMEVILGTATEQFKLLYAYAEEIMNCNPGTRVIIKAKPVVGNPNQNKFKRLYICWGALKDGLLEGCRPVIGLDGCHLKGPHGGVLLTAVGIDANNCIYPFAYAVVEKEKRKTWQWFLELIGEDLDIVNTFGWTFMSDKQKGLIEAVSDLFPNASHRFCVRHLYNNFKGTCD